MCSLVGWNQILNILLGYRFLIGYRWGETKLKMRKIKTKAELKGLAQVPHPSFTQVTFMILQCHWHIALHWDICVKCWSWTSKKISNEKFWSEEGGSKVVWIFSGNSSIVLIPSVPKFQSTTTGADIPNLTLYCHRLSMLFRHQAASLRCPQSTARWFNFLLPSYYLHTTFIPSYLYLHTFITS